MRTLKAINVLLCAAWSISGGYNLSPTQKEPTTYEQIKILKPKINPKLAQKISVAIGKNCAPQLQTLVVAIIFVESSFLPTATSVTGDIGLSQFSPRLAVQYNLGTERLVKDVDYAIKHTCKILAKKKRWWHWHSRTEKYAKPYREKVKKAVEKIQETR